MYEKQHVILEQYTGMEKNIDALSKIQADCMFNIKVGICKPGACSTCKKCAMIKACIDQLSICDQLIVENMSTEMYNSRLYDYNEHVRYKKSVKRSKLLITVISLIAIIVLWSFILTRVS